MALPQVPITLIWAQPSDRGSNPTALEKPFQAHTHTHTRLSLKKKKNNQFVMLTDSAG